MGTHNFKCYLLPRNSKCEFFLTCTVTNDDAVYTFELPWKHFSIAKVGEVSISTALNLFRNVLNTSPVNYLICYRLRKAALLLTNTEKKVSAISIETGFSNTDYFCKTFKRMYSLTPTEYRNVKKWIIRRKKGDLSRPFISAMVIPLCMLLISFSFTSTH